MRLGILLGTPSESTPVPLTISGLVWWVRADLGITTSGGNVTGWADQSGLADSARDLANEGTDKPAYNATDSNYNNQATIGTFRTGTDCRLVTGSSWSTTYDGGGSGNALTVIAIGDAVSGTTAYFTMASGSDYIAILNNPADQAIVYSDNSTGTINTGGGTGPVTAPGLIAAEFNGASSKLFTGSLSSGTAGTLGTTTLGNEAFHLGAYTGGSSSSFGVNRIAEVLIYDKVLSSGEKTSLVNYLNTRYGASFT